MKKEISLSVVVAVTICFVVIFLSSCSSSNKEIDIIPKSPSHGEIVEMYVSAREAYSWLKLNQIEYDENDTIIERNYTYYRCIDPRLDNTGLRALNQYLNCYFSEKFTKELMDSTSTQFVEREDKLYYMPLGIGSNVYAGKEEISDKVQKLSDSEMIITLNTQMLDENLKPSGKNVESELQLIYEKDKWVFNEFDIPAIDW